MDLFELTKKLISIPSISGDEKNVAEFLAGYLSDLGFEVQLQEAEPGRPNVYARRGEPDVVLSTHTDTVPPYVAFREDDEYLYGRGACDTKGIIAAMLKAAESLIDSNVTDFGAALCRGRGGGKSGGTCSQQYSEPLAILDQWRADGVQTRRGLERILESGCQNRRASRAFRISRNGGIGD